MQKNYKKIWCSLIVCLLLTICFPYNLSADSATYYLMPDDGSVLELYYVPTVNSNKTYGRMQSPINSVYNPDVRVSLFYDGTDYHLVFMSTTNSYKYKSVGYGLNSSAISSAGTATINNISLWMNHFVNPLRIDVASEIYLNVINISEYSNEVAYSYMYGENSSGGQPVINYGELIDLGFYTNFTNSQQSNYYQMRYNKDTIQWNGYEDSLGNQINTLNMQVEIQAYATEYSASSKSDLLNKTILDLVNYGSPQTIYEGSANIGEKSFTWGEVADALNGSSTTIDWWSNLAPHSYESMWYANGWLYRIRLKTADESFIGNWQIIYGITSAPPEDSETIYNYYYYYGGQGISDDVVDVLNNINTTNNTQNIWYINNNPVDPSSGSSWLETLLKFIADMIGRILDLFGTMFDSVLDFLLGLFEGFDPVGSFIDWWNQLKIKFNSIDLTLPWFNLPEDEDLSSFGVLVQKTIEIYTLNDLGFMIYIPLLLLILKVVFL